MLYVGAQHWSSQETVSLNYLPVNYILEKIISLCNIRLSRCPLFISIFLRIYAAYLPKAIKEGKPIKTAVEILRNVRYPVHVTLYVKSQDHSYARIISKWIRPGIFYHYCDFDT